MRTSDYQQKFYMYQKENGDTFLDILFVDSIGSQVAKLTLSIPVTLSVSNQ